MKHEHQHHIWPTVIVIIITIITIILDITGCEEGTSICAILMTLASVLIIIITLPVSLLMTVKVVQVFTINFNIILSILTLPLSV